MDACAARELTDETLASRYHCELDAFMRDCFSRVKQEASNGGSRVAININQGIPIQLIIRKLNQHGYRLEQINGQLIIKW